MAADRRSRVRGQLVDRAIGALLIVNIVAVIALLMIVATDWMKAPGARPVALAATPSPSASAAQMVMGIAHIPTTSSCLLCHESGGSSGLKAVPALGHPLSGWERCTVCHTDERLGRTAPGHTGIAEAECVKCHSIARPGPAITQAHSDLKEACLDCHGKIAHLPASMVGRSQDECWLCHKPAPQPAPEYPHSASEPLACRSCHRSSDTGALPIDHALRGDSTCLLCHTIRTVDSPAPLLVPSPSGPPAPSGSPPTAGS